MKYVFVGDIHGQFVNFHSIIDHCSNDTNIIQVGDLGIGFNLHGPKYFKSNVYFIRGNHDNPEECHKFANYLGDYGYNEYLNLFYLSGAYSIDKNLRTPFIDWWPDEEISIFRGNLALEEYNIKKPKLIVTHECPDSVLKHLRVVDLSNINANLEIIQSRTSRLLEEMFSLHKPDLWIFGHHHRSFDKIVEGTRFICVPELGQFKINIVNE